MKVTTKGQVTIPQHIRRFLGISAYSEVDFAIRDDEVILMKVSKSDQSHPPIGRFRRLRGMKKGTMSTDQWMKATRGE